MRVFLTILCLALVGCGGLPYDIVERAQGLPQRIEDSRKEVDEREKRYLALTQKSGFEFYRPYAEREKWSDYFEQAKSELNRVQEVFEKEINPILERDEEEDARKLLRQLDRVSRILREVVVELAKKAGARMTFLVEAKKTAPRLVENGETQLAIIDGLMPKLESYLATAKRDYPKKAKEIDGRFSPLRQLQTAAQERMEEVRPEFRAHEGGQVADYAKLGDGTHVVAANLEKLVTGDRVLRSKIGELYQSYTKVLVDMRADHYVQVGRTSWNNSYDFPPEHQYLYTPRRVDQATWDYFANLPPEQPLGTLPNIFSSGIAIDEAMWNELLIDRRNSWPGRDDDAEYWLNDIPVTYYHKYIFVRNAQKEETDWVEVDEDEFTDYGDALGMEIVSKPYGLYEEEKLKEPAPPGMAYVGNEKYGQWEKDSSGNSFWAFYGRYALMRNLFWGPGFYRPYYYNSWSAWNSGYRGRRGYYGPDPNRPVYGTYGSSTRQNPRYQRSSFGRSGGFRRAAASTRGAGASSRGRGPGGRGGK